MNQSRKDVETTLAAIEKFNQEIATWSKEQALAYLVKLGTHNIDGTLHENYGGKKKGK